MGTGWDFLDPRHREAALKLIRRSKPYVLILAFPYNVWSLLQNLNPTADLQAKRKQAEVLVILAIEAALLHLRGGRRFLIENPATSAAWNLDAVLDFRNHSDVLEVVLDMCRFGLKGHGGELHKKAPRFLTSSQALVSAFLERRCRGDRKHAWVMGGSKITSVAGHYTPEFSDAVVEAFMTQYDFEQALAQCHSAFVVDAESTAEHDHGQDLTPSTQMVHFSGFGSIFDPQHDFHWLDTSSVQEFVEPDDETFPPPSLDIHACRYILSSGQPCSFVGHNSLSLCVHMVEKHNLRGPFKHAVVTNQCPCCMSVFKNKRSAQQHAHKRGIKGKCPAGSS